MPHWHWHIFTLTWVRAFKSSGGSLCTMNSLQNTRDIAMDIDIDKMFPKGFSSDLTFRPTPFNLWVQGTNLGIDWIPRGWDGSSKMGSQANIFNLWVQETNLEQRPPLGIFCAEASPGNGYYAKSFSNVWTRCKGSSLKLHFVSLYSANAI